MSNISKNSCGNVFTSGTHPDESVPDEIKLRGRGQAEVSRHPNHALISDVLVQHCDYKWKERIPGPGREGIK